MTVVVGRMSERVEPHSQAMVSWTFHVESSPARACLADRANCGGLAVLLEN